MKQSFLMLLTAIFFVGFAGCASSSEISKWHSIKGVIKSNGYWKAEGIGKSLNLSLATTIAETNARMKIGRFLSGGKDNFSYTLIFSTPEKRRTEKINGNWVVKIIISAPIEGNPEH